MIEQDDVLYLKGKMYVVRLVAANTYVVREYLGNGELGGYENLRHEIVELHPTLEFVGTWDELNSQILWDSLRNAPPAPHNVRHLPERRKDPKKERAEHNQRVLEAYKIKEKK